MRGWLCLSVKNQYFGDVNDYRKYSLLRTLCGERDITAAVCWMLTPDDGRTDGSLIEYLNQPDEWCHFDPDLFQHLRKLVLRRNLRDVHGVENADILPCCRFFSEPVPDYAEQRAAWFHRFVELAKGCDLIFFDPDNGIEVKSKPYGRKGSSKYLYWAEIERSFEGGHSLLIYQHFPRVNKDPYIRSKAARLAVRTGAREVISFRTPRVLFLLAPQEEHVGLFRESSKQVADVWRSQMRVASHQS